jgi:hypothetical protein
MMISTILMFITLASYIPISNATNILLMFFINLIMKSPSFFHHSHKISRIDRVEERGTLRVRDFCMVGTKMIPHI